MAKAIQSGHPRHARKPSPKAQTSGSESRNQVASHLAQRNLLAAVLDAAAEDDLPSCLRQIVVGLGKYSKCSCIGVTFVLEDGTSACCTSCRDATESRVVPGASFPRPATSICDAILGVGSHTRPSLLTEGGSFFRKGKPVTSATAQVTDGPSGVCIGNTFQSVALIPVRYLKTVVGFIFVGDEGKDKIPLKTFKFLERVGNYVGSTIGSLQARDRMRLSTQGLPGQAGEASTTSRSPDEMDLLTRLMENSNESIVISQDWRIIHVNNKCAEMAGLSKEDMIGLAFLDITHPDDRSAVKERYSRILNGEWFSSGTTLRGLDKDGNTRWAELREIPFSWHGRPAVMSLVHDITDRKRAEEALAASEKKYRQLVETLDEGIAAIDQNAKLVLANPRMAEIFGYTVDEMMGRNVLSFLAEVGDEAGMAAVRRKLETRRQGTREEYEARARRKDGAEIYLSLRSSPILDDEGKYTGVIAAVQDITDRKKAEQALRDSERLYRFLADNTTDVIWVTDMNLKPSYFSPSISSLTGYSVDEATIGTLETRLTPASAKAASRVFGDAYTREKQKPGSTRSRTMELELKRKDGSTVWVNTTVSFMRDSEGRAIGILGAMRNVTDRRRAEEALKQSEANYRSLFEQTLLGMEVIDGQTGRTVLANRSLARMFGFKSPDDMVGTNPFDYVLPEDLEWVASQITQLMADPTWAKTAQIRSRTEDGRIIWLTGMGTPIEYEGQPAMLLSLVDITGAKEAETKLHESEERYRLVVENANEAIVVLQDGLVKYANPKGTELVGRPGEKLSPTSFLDFVHPDDRQMMMDNHLKRLAGEKVPNNYTFRMIDKEGTTKWIQINAVLFDWEGRPAVLSMLNDITDRTKAEEALRDSERHYRFLADNTTDVIWVADLNMRPTYFSPSVAAVMGYTVEEAMSSALYNRLTPASAEIAANALAEALATEKQKPGSVTPMTIELEGIRKDNSRVWVETTVSFTRDSGGRAIGILGAMRDITERRQARETLRASEERYRLLVETANEAIAVIQDGTLRFISPKIEDISGYEVADVVSKSFIDFIHPDDRQMIAEHYMRRLKGEESPQSYQFRFIDNSGSTKWVQVNVVLMDWEGKTATLALISDITDWKRVNDALKASEERFRTIIENARDAITIVDEEFKIIYESPSLARVTGYPPEEWLGKSMGEMHIHPDDVPLLASNFDLLRKQPGSAVEDVSVRYRHRDGSWHVIEASARSLLQDPRVGGIVINFRDITDRRRAEDALRQQEQLFRALAENSSDIIVLLNRDGTISYESPAAQHMLGLTPQERIGSPPFDRVHPDDMPAVTAAFAELLRDPSAGAKRVDEVRLEHKDGSWRVAEATGSAILHDGNVHGIVINIHDITERKRATEELRESEKRYRLLAENITDVIWTTDMQTNITYMSPSATRLVNFTPEELGQMTVADLLTPDSFERGMKALAEQQVNVTHGQGGQPDHWTLEVQLRRKDGSVLWAEEKVTFLRDEDGTPIGLVGATRDISQRKAAEDALRLSEEKYRTLVEASPDGVLSIDGRGIITDCNTGLCRMLGYEREGLCGREARSLGTKKDLDAEPYYHDHLARGEFTEVETEIIRHDGQTLPVWAKLVRLVEPNTADINTIIYFRDIADRRKIDEMKDEFVGLVSHELRSPLTVIIGALNTAISEGPRLSQKETRQLLEDAAAEAEQLSHLVGNLLELSRAQANRLFLHVEPVNLAKATQKVIGSIQRQSSKHKFVVDLPKKLPPVSADQLRLERILHNLLENSVKYSPEGSEITVSAKREAGHLVVSVSDQGPGISKEDQAKLFKPFQQLGNPMLDHTKGAGLGLLVCRRLVEAHGGRIWVESEPGHGATFRFTLEAGTTDNPQTGQPG